MIKGLLIGFFCFILFLFLHAIIFHYREIDNRFNVLTRIFYGLFPVYTILYFLIPGDLYVLIPADPTLTSRIVLVLSRIINFFGGFGLYIFLFLGYCQFYFIVDRSISVKIMIELENSSNKQLTFEEIKKVYNPDQIFLRRLGHMVDGKYIRKNSDYYQNTKKGHYEARLFKFLKEFLKLGPGG